MGATYNDVNETLYLDNEEMPEESILIDAGGTQCLFVREGNLNGLKADNAELRELVKELVESFCTHECCWDMFCGHEYPGPCDPDEGVCWFKDRVRELGIDVM